MHKSKNHAKCNLNIYLVFVGIPHLYHHLKKVIFLGSFYKFFDTVEVSTDDKLQELFNGDKLTFKLTYDEEKAKEVGVKFTSDTVVYTVKGLED